MRKLYIGLNAQIRNYDLLTYLLTRVKSRDVSASKNINTLLLSREQGRISNDFIKHRNSTSVYDVSVFWVFSEFAAVCFDQVKVFWCEYCDTAVKQSEHFKKWL